MADTDTQAKLPTVSYGSFATALDKFYEAGGAPNEIHPSAFHKGTFSGSTIALLVKAFRALNLVDAKDHPHAERVDRLIDPKSRKTAVTELLTEHFGTLIDLPLSKASPKQFNEWFDQFNMGADDARKAKTFFLHAAKANGIAVSKFITDQYKTRTPSSGTRKRTKKNAGGGDGAGNGDNSSNNDTVQIENTIVDRLLDKFPEFDPAWAPEVQAKWFEAFAKLQQQLGGSNG
jgi:hypothetical protein